MKANYSDIYTVYSGGDDILVLGPWDQIFDLAIELREKFALYTCDNPAWKLSAGIAVVSPKTPVLMAVELADKQLDMSKGRRDNEGNKIKNALSAFNETMSWDEAKNSIDKGKQLIEWMRDGTLNSGKVWRLHLYSQMFQEYQRSNKKNTNHLQYIPQFIYDVKRNWGDNSEEEKKALSWAQTLANPAGEEIKKLSFICQYALNGVRKKEGEVND